MYMNVHCAAALITGNILIAHNVIVYLRKPQLTYSQNYYESDN